MSKTITVNGVTLVQDDRYHLYRAADCRKTGLPMLDGYSRYASGMPPLLSATQRKKAGCPVHPDEQPVAWYLMMHGYAPLYPPGGAEDD